jgi:hypothetical protein
MMLGLLNFGMNCEFTFQFPIYLQRYQEIVGVKVLATTTSIHTLCTYLYQLINLECLYRKIRTSVFIKQIS